MREVINYKPDIFTRCFCILALLVGHGCQYISSSWASLCMLPLSPSKVALGAQFTQLTGLRDQMSQCKTVTPQVFKVFLCCIHLLVIHILLCVFIPILFIQRWSASSICFVPGVKMIRMLMHHGTFKTLT